MLNAWTVVTSHAASTGGAKWVGDLTAQVGQNERLCGASAKVPDVVEGRALY